MASPNAHNWQFFSPGFAKGLWLSSAASLLLGACYHPPYNNFKPHNPHPARVTKGAVIGTAAGAIMSPVGAGMIPAGAAAGAVIAGVNSLYREGKNGIVNKLRANDIEYIEYGDTRTLIVPTDRYFLFNSAELNDICYPGLEAILAMINLHPHSPITIAGFTDNVGQVRKQQQLSEARAQEMLGFLWANGLSSARLQAQGLASRFAVADNRTVHGSAQNRRLEIQWQITNKPPCCKVVHYQSAMK